MTPRLAYSLREAAEAMSISVRSLRYLMRTGRLGYAKLGRRCLIPHTELEKVLRRATVRATEPLDADAAIRPVSRHSNAPEATPEASENGVSSARRCTAGAAYESITSPPT
jgi:excisionase family DNA binding protein